MVKEFHQLFMAGEPCTPNSDARQLELFTFVVYCKLVILECKPKAMIVDICEKCDSYIRE